MTFGTIEGEIGNMNTDEVYETVKKELEVVHFIDTKRLSVIDPILACGIDFNGEVQLLIDDSDQIEVNYSLNDEDEFREPQFFENIEAGIKEFVVTILLIDIKERESL